MTHMLEEAIRVARELPESEQDALAATILAEIEDERRWADLFAQSPDTLAELAREALEEHRAGRTLPLDPERM
jgi:urease gamma subunit